jgi:hypothetical protein
MVIARGVDGRTTERRKHTKKIMARFGKVLPLGLAMIHFIPVSGQSPINLSNRNPEWGDDPYGDFLSCAEWDGGNLQTILPKFELNEIRKR